MRYLVFVIALSWPLAAASTCENLAKLALPHSTVTLAQAVAAGQFDVAGRSGAAVSRLSRRRTSAICPPFCRVAATLKPTSDSDIKIEVWMPASGWNGRLESVGNGAWAGSISYRDLAAAVTDRLRGCQHRHRPHRDNAPHLWSGIRKS